MSTTDDGESNPSRNELEQEGSSGPLLPSPTTQSCEESGLVKKRGEYKKRSKAWDHFHVKHVNGVRHAICKYCEKDIAADPKSHGTTPLNTHVAKCPLNPKNKHTGQATLCLGETETLEGEVKGALISWKFDAEAIRKSIADMVIVDELPFKHVEGRGFQYMMRTACPSFKIPSRWTISRDCYQLYLDEKIKLKHLLKNNSGRICLTTDSWTSIQRINYMCLTAHFIDNDWKLNKKILNFCPIASHKGTEVGKAIEKCLLEWGVDDILTVTVDNASSNDVAVSYLRGKLQNWGKAVLRGKWTHVRYVAHIVNLIVNDGIKKLGDSVDCIRAAVRYVRQSPSRLKKFKECVEIEKTECKRLLCLDVSTGWNSTYLMLDTAQRFERAFERFEEQDPYMLQELENLPTKSDWTKARFLVIFLENFYQLTVKVSGSKYVISNNFFTDISHIHGILIEMTASDNEELSSMARSMKEKYDKYWGKIEKMNMLIFISSMLDPRTKLEYLEFVVCQMYGESDGTTIAGLAKDAMFELFNEYKMLNTPASNSVSHASSLSSESQRSKTTFYGHGDASKTITDRYKLEFKKRKMELGGRDAKSELEKYLNEDCEEDDERFDILLWWKANSLRFPILSKVARDVLAVPISTVASESAFSTGSRVLDTFRSSLTPRIVQSLICAQDWFRSSKTELNVEENLEELEAFESELLKTGTESTIIDAKL
ncbi:zinc finger BED domain-containing protein RICESLEEPER 2-like [Coffea arabica]|uniref:Zinc finger BED domain-containing protein RICESLEEPER 2-like n=1 Tax=Coffea arabica TaxID=13443 RepID=A0A6P6XB34_COFAR|nr:zinc finger BED domain-containing protein RICESLEEPER 2-like [Coffea arabica]